MPVTNLRSEDWEHRLHVLWAWRECRHFKTGDREKGAIYRAVLDGCAVTLRSLCGIVGVKCQFRKATLSNGKNRTRDLLGCCNSSGKLLVVCALPPENQRCLLEALYFANRAIAHPDDGGLDHNVAGPEMTLAINTVLEWLRTGTSKWPTLSNVPKEFLEPIT